MFTYFPSTMNTFITGKREKCRSKQLTIHTMRELDMQGHVSEQMKAKVHERCIVA